LVNNTRVDKDRAIASIRQLKKEDRNDREIMDTLGIPLRSYRIYVSEIHKDDKIAWLLTSRTQLEPELLKLKESFENTYDRALELSKTDQYDVLVGWFCERVASRYPKYIYDFCIMAI
jgi:hypothetical protein